MEKMLNLYYANNANKLHRVVDKILSRFGGLSDKDLDDFYSLANEVFVDVMRRYDDSQSFDSFLYSCLSNKIKTEITRKNREKRRADRMSISIDTPIGDDEDTTIGDMLADDFTIEKELFERNQRVEWRKEVREYLDSLSPLQRRIAYLLSDNQTPVEICEALHISNRHFENSMKRILADERIRPLRALAERM
ncbi:MAG: sigma-70 family RNA polymerase sigma factor [bacterium]|nr:sigma-70 family RNA polymerase sigma factor [bacterium]